MAVVEYRLEDLPPPLDPATNPHASGIYVQRDGPRITGPRVIPVSQDGLFSTNFLGAGQLPKLLNDAFLMFGVAALFFTELVVLAAAVSFKVPFVVYGSILSLITQFLVAVHFSLRPTPGPLWLAVLFNLVMFPAFFIGIATMFWIVHEKNDNRTHMWLLLGAQMYVSILRAVSVLYCMLRLRRSYYARRCRKRHKVNCNNTSDDNVLDIVPPEDTTSELHGWRLWTLIRQSLQQNPNQYPNISRTNSASSNVSGANPAPPVVPMVSENWAGSGWEERDTRPFWKRWLAPNKAPGRPRVPLLPNGQLFWIEGHIVDKIDYPVDIFWRGNSENGHSRQPVRARDGTMQLPVQASILPNSVGVSGGPVPTLPARVSAGFSTTDNSSSESPPVTEYSNVGEGILEGTLVVDSTPGSGTPTPTPRQQSKIHERMRKESGSSNSRHIAPLAPHVHAREEVVDLVVGDSDDDVTAPSQVQIEEKGYPTFGVMSIEAPQLLGSNHSSGYSTPTEQGFNGNATGSGSMISRLSMSRIRHAKDIYQDIVTQDQPPACPFSDPRWQSSTDGCGGGRMTPTLLPLQDEPPCTPPSQTRAGGFGAVGCSSSATGNKYPQFPAIPLATTSHATGSGNITPTMTPWPTPFATPYPTPAKSTYLEESESSFPFPSPHGESCNDDVSSVPAATFTSGTDDEAFLWNVKRQRAQHAPFSTPKVYHRAVPAPILTSPRSEASQLYPETSPAKQLPIQRKKTRKHYEPDSDMIPPPPPTA